MTDLNNASVDPLSDKSSVGVVLIFISNDCPIANRYVPEINRLYEKFTRRGVTFWLVHADPGETAEEIRRHASEYGLRPPEIRDPKHELVKLAHAEVTPSAAVFVTRGGLVYHGRIDDRVVKFGVERPEALRHELNEVLEAVVDRRAVPFSTAKAIGCYIPQTPP